MEKKVRDNLIWFDVLKIARKAERSRCCFVVFSRLRANNSRSSNLYIFKLFDAIGRNPNGKFSDIADIRTKNYIAVFCC